MTAANRFPLPNMVLAIMLSLLVLLSGPTPEAFALGPHPAGLGGRVGRGLVSLATITAALEPDGAVAVEVVEHLKVRVPATARRAWLEAEAGSWEPWLRRQPGFLKRELLWDVAREEGILLIHWASREQWKAIPEQEVQQVQERFEQLARVALERKDEANPFPLVYEGELEPQGPQAGPA
jgi:uncharacterized protein (TIGR03792 family)